MYTPAHFAETDAALLHEAMRRHPLATLVTPTDAGFEVNHLPLVLHPELGPHGTLRGHVARANPLWRSTRADAHAAAVFTAAEHYVSPSWYPGKAQDPRVVPTWNYLVIHAWGPLVVHDDIDWLRAHLPTLTDQQEGHREDRWRVSDAPRDYLDKMMAAIVGIEIPVVRLEGKRKTSQNRGAADRAGVAAGLTREGTTPALAMARLVG